MSISQSKYQCPTSQPDRGRADWPEWRTHLSLELCYPYDLPLTVGDKSLFACCQGVTLILATIAKAAIIDD